MPAVHNNLASALMKLGNRDGFRPGQLQEAIAHLNEALRESPDYELCQISERKPGVLDELAAERKKLLEKETAELEGQASRLADEIKELSGQTVERIL